MTLSACFGGDEPEEVPQPPPASDDAQSQQAPAPQQSQQDQQPAQPQQVSTIDDEQQQPQQQAAAPIEQEEPELIADNEYIVQPGDTLSRIADAHGVRLDDLIQINNIQNPNALSVGQVLLIPSDEPQPSAAETTPTSDDEADEAQQEEVEPVETPTVTLPNTALGMAAPTTTSSAQFAQPGADITTSTIPTPPTSFLQYGAALLPWLHGLTTVADVLPAFDAWPMPSLAVGNNRVWLIDTDGDGAFSIAIIFTDPSSFGAAVPFSNLVVYDPVPSRPDRYRIGYDHRLAYGREVQGLQLLADQDMTGDGIRDISLREISCSEDLCTSAFYILQASGDGYRVITGGDALIDEVSGIQLSDGTADGVADLIVSGQSRDDNASYSFTLSAQFNAITEISRIPAAN